MNLRSTYVGVFGLFGFFSSLSWHKFTHIHTGKWDEHIVSSHMCKYTIICVPLFEILYLG